MTDTQKGQHQQAQSEENVQASDQDASIKKIQALLKTKNDTSRFVGLALLKSVLDNSPALREDEGSVAQLWHSIPPRFLDRLLRTGAAASSSSSSSSSKDAKDMLDLAVAVVHTFAVLLPESKRGDQSLVARIPLLVASVLHSSEETTKLILETLATLVSSPEGAGVFNRGVDDLSPLTEIAPSHPLVLEILSLAWLNSSFTDTDAPLESKQQLLSRIDETVQALVSAFKGTDAVTLLAFLGRLLRNLDAEIIPRNPRWLPQVTDFIRGLVARRPTAAGRAAYTNLAATLLQVYPLAARRLLFSDNSTPATTKGKGTATAAAADEKPFSYLLINLILVDLRATLPGLLAQLNSPGYAETSTRLASAFDVLSSFIGYLVQSLDSNDDDAMPVDGGTIPIPPDLLLKLRRTIAETLSATIEFLRDRWDASVGGALGLHPDARITKAALTWDAKDNSTGGVASDPLVLAAVRALALWLREDDNASLRAEAAGLCDMLIDLYRTSCSSSSHPSSSPSLDFRRPVLVALEGITAPSSSSSSSLQDGGVGVNDDGDVEMNADAHGIADDTDGGGIEALLKEDIDAWGVLTGDLLSILFSSSSSSSSSSPSSPSPQEKEEKDEEEEAARGIEIIRLLLPLVEAERPYPREAWLDLVTRIAAWDVPDPDSSASHTTTVDEFRVATLQLATALLAGSHPGARRRYAHSASAVAGVARRLRRRLARLDGDGGLLESLDDVIETLDDIRTFK